MYFTFITVQEVGVKSKKLLLLVSW